MYYPIAILNCVQVRARVPFADGEWSKLVPVGKTKDLYSTVYSCAIIVCRLYKVKLHQKITEHKQVMSFVEYSLTHVAIVYY